MSFFKKLFGGRTSKESNAKDLQNLDDPVLDMGVKFIDDYILAGIGSYNAKKKLSDLKIWSDIKNQDEAFRADLCHAAVIKRLSKENKRRRKKGDFYLPQKAEARIPGLLMRKPLPYSEAQLRDMILECSKRTYLEHDNPIKGVLKSTEAHFKDKDLSNPIKSALKLVIKKSHSGYTDNRDVRNIREMAETLLSGISEFRAPNGPWTDKFLEQIESKSAEQWDPLLQYAMTASGSEPTKKWSSQADVLLRQPKPNPSGLTLIRIWPKVWFGFQPLSNPMKWLWPLAGSGIIVSSRSQAMDNGTKRLVMPVRSPLPGWRHKRRFQSLSACVIKTNIRLPRQRLRKSSKK